MTPERLDNLTLSSLVTPERSDNLNLPFPLPPERLRFTAVDREQSCPLQLVNVVSCSPVYLFPAIANPITPMRLFILCRPSVLFFCLAPPHSAKIVTVSARLSPVTSLKFFLKVSFAFPKL